MECKGKLKKKKLELKKKKKMDGLRTSTSQLTKSGLETSVDVVAAPDEVTAMEVSGEKTAWVPPANLFNLLWNITSWYGEKQFLGVREKNPDGSFGAYKWTTYSEAWELSSFLGAGLLAKGLMEARDFLGICSPNRPEWIFADFCTIQYNYVSVPLVVTLDEETLAFVLNETGIRCVVASDDMIPKLKAAAPKCPNLKSLVSMDNSSSNDGSIPVYALKDVMEVGASSFPGEFPGTQRKSEELWTLVYTSGSTGMPKGAIMTDQRWTKFCTRGYLMPNPIRLLSFAPFGHVSERQLYWITAFYGGQYGFYCGNMERLFDDMQEINPTYLSCPPRIYNAVYAEYKELVDAEVLKRGASERWRIEMEMLALFRNKFGNAVQFLVTGSAPTSEAVKEFLRRCFGVPLYDGYGTTETGGIATDGILGSEVDCFLIDVPELGYLSTDKPYPRGEICVHTDVMIEGYFKNPGKTAESFVERDGKKYFRTGDIGVRRLGHEVQIIDRVKNVFKLSQGEFVAPAKVEDVLEKSPMIHQICVCGAPTKCPDRVIAVIVPSLETCSKFFEATGKPKTLEELVSKHGKQLEAFVLADINRLVKRSQLIGFEVPTRVVFSQVIFTPENDLLTPSFKLRRGPIEKFFAKEIAAIIEAPAPLDALDDSLKKTLGDVLGQEATQLTLDQSFKFHGGDSLSAVRLVSRIKREFGKDVPLSFVLQNPSLQELSKFIMDGTSSESQQLSLPKAALEDLINPRSHLGPATGRPVAWADVESVLVTGATGFLGAFLVRDVLNKLPKAKVICVVRGQNAEERLRKSFSDRRLNVDFGRIEVISGDLSEGLLGFGDLKTFNSMCRRVDAVFNSAAQVNWMQSYDALRTSNVTPCYDLIRFCTTGKPKHCVHVSTISCCPLRSYNLENGNKAYESYEEFADDSWAAALGPYGQSKYIAEKVLFGCVPELSLTLVRPANIMADSSTGASNITDYPDRYLQTAVEIGAFMDEAAVLNFTPVDYVSSCILKVAMNQPQEQGHIYNISDNSSPTYSAIGNQLIRAGFNLKKVTYVEFRKLLLEHAEPQKLSLYGLLPMFTEKAFIYSMVERADCSGTLKYCENAPVISSEHLEKWVEYLKSIHAIGSTKQNESRGSYF